MPKARDITLTPERLRELLDYDRGTGIFIRKWRSDLAGKAVSANLRFAGKPAGRIMNAGYIVICIDYRSYLAQRLVWVMERGSISTTDSVDHINGIKTDNRIQNLRIVSHATNRQNNSRRSNTGCGSLGVNPLSSGKWRASAYLNNRHVHLGVYSTQAQAAEVALAFREKYYVGWTGRDN